MTPASDDTQILSRTIILPSNKPQGDKHFPLYPFLRQKHQSTFLLFLRISSFKKLVRQVYIQIFKLIEMIFIRNCAIQAITQQGSCSEEHWKSLKKKNISDKNYLMNSLNQHSFYVDEGRKVINILVRPFFNLTGYQSFHIIRTL